MQNSVEILDELQTLSATKSSENRRALLHRITDLFEITSDTQEETHRTAFDQIMERLAYELETSVRAEFADRLADLENAPKKLSQRFAVDEIDVARPVLQRSKILSDEFLVKVVQTQSQDHLLAISNRDNINTKVTDALVDKGNNEVLQKVSANAGAKFSRQSFEKLTQSAASDSKLSDTLKGRLDTPDDLLEVIKTHVSEKIKNEAAQLGIDISDLDIDSTIDEKSADIKVMDAETEAAFQEIEYLHKRKQLDERVINHYVNLGKVDETVFCLSQLTEIDQATVNHCLMQAELPALAVMCKANSFERSTFASLLQLRGNQNESSATQIVEAIRKYEGLDLPTAQRVMRFLKVRGAAKSSAPQNTGDSNPGELEAQTA